MDMAHGYAGRVRRNELRHSRHQERYVQERNRKKRHVSARRPLVCDRAHFNPAVTLADASQGGWREAPGYIVAQVAGAFCGVFAAHLMFAEPVYQVSEHVRSGGAQQFSEFVATFGLLSVIWICVRHRSEAVPYAVGAYITSAYWFTASTSFANPAVTLARSFSNTFAGIRLVDAPGFIAAQLLGATAATILFRWLSHPCLRMQRMWCFTIPIERSDVMIKPKVLFLCTANSSRTQMAEGFLRSVASDRFEIVSAGGDPGEPSGNLSYEMKEVGVDIVGQTSKDVSQFFGVRFTYVVHLCDRHKEQQCPIFPGAIYRLTWDLESPADSPHGIEVATPSRGGSRVL